MVWQGSSRREGGEGGREDEDKDQGKDTEEEEEAEAEADEQERETTHTVPKLHSRSVVIRRTNLVDGRYLC